MSMYERLDYLLDGKPDFLLVAPPSLTQHREVEALKDILDERCAALDRKQRSPLLLQEHLALEYRKVGAVLFPAVPVESLLPGSRHRFFHGEPGGLSGLQRLLGYTMGAAQEGEPAIVISSGDVVLDCVVDLALSPFGALTPWLTGAYGVRDTLLLLTQAANRQMGQEAVNKIQQEQDKAAWQTIKGSVGEEIQQQGLDVLSMMGL